MTDQRRVESQAEQSLKVRPLVGLALLEAVRDVDVPTETFEDENLSYTMPRRFGVNRVIAVQIDWHREAARSGQHMRSQELVDLIRLVARRPDAEQIFRLAGSRLARPAEGGPGLYRIVPEFIRRWRAAADLRKRTRNVLGRSFGVVTRDPLAMEAELDLLVQGDASGRACSMMAELIRSTARRHLTEAVTVRHVDCVARGGRRCRWEVEPDQGEAAPMEQVEGTGL